MKYLRTLSLSAFGRMVFLLVFGLMTQKASAFTCYNNGVEVAYQSTVNVIVPINPMITEGYNEIVDLSKYIACGNLQPENYVDGVSISGTALSSSMASLNGVLIMKGVKRNLPQGSTFYGNIQTRLPSKEKLDIQLGIIPKPGATGNVLIKRGDLITTLNLVQTSNGKPTANINWRIVANNDAILPTKSCKVTGSGTVTVPLDSITKNTVAQAGKTDAGSKPFNLVFDCPANAPVSVTPSGTALVAAQGVYKNLSTGTTAATKIGVAMECDNGSGTYAPLVPGTKLSLGTTAVEGLTTRTCKASYYSQGNATEGVVSAQTTLTFTYN